MKSKEPFEPDELADEIQDLLEGKQIAVCLFSIAIVLARQTQNSKELKRYLKTITEISNKELKFETRNHDPTDTKH